MLNTMISHKSNKINTCVLTWLNTNGQRSETTKTSKKE